MDELAPPMSASRGGPSPLDVNRSLFSFSNRLLALERQVDTLRNNLQLLEEDIIEKHKEALKQVGAVQDQMADLKNENAQARQAIERLVDRLSEFASKESMDVLQKTVDFWQPLDFVTRREVEDLISKARKK